MIFFSVEPQHNGPVLCGLDGIIVRRTKLSGESLSPQSALSSTAMTYLVVGLQPQRLKLGVAVFLVRELVVLQYVVHFSEVSQVKSHDGSSSENTLGLVQFLHIGVGHG